MRPETGLWRISVEVREAELPAMETVLAKFCETRSWFRTEGGGWQMDGLAGEEPDRTAVDLAMAVTAAAVGMPPPRVVVERLATRDWLADNLADFPPLTVGRMFVHGSHFRETVPAGRIGLCIDAATAFGSGRHPSTAGCLRAIDGLRRRPSGPTLDLGCGSAILALAIAKRWRTPVIAADRDRRAVQVAAGNARRNGLAAWVRVAVADGPSAAVVVRSGPYALIACNILARPIRGMASRLIRLLAPGGRMILSGFVAGDGRGVLSTYHTQGLVVEWRVNINGWETLVLRRPGVGGSPPLTRGWSPKGS
jgi:ribosomal protein L11 methyltransferase